MATIVNTPGGTTNGDGSATGVVVGILVVLLIIVLFLVFGLPYIRGTNAPANSDPGVTGTVNVTIPTGTGQQQ